MVIESPALARRSRVLRSPTYRMREEHLTIAGLNRNQVQLSQPHSFRFSSLQGHWLKGKLIKVERLRLST